MTSPTQRRHAQIIGRLDALIDAVTIAAGVKPSKPMLHDLDDVAREFGVDLTEPVDVTEEPPIGSQVTDVDGEVWGRFKEGWQVWAALGYMEWSGVSDPWVNVRACAPLRLTTDADRERVGLPVDTAPDVDPDDTEAYLTGKRTPDQAEQLAARVLDLEADVERLTRERDEARRDVANVARDYDQQRDRYEALRADVEHALKEAAKHSEWLRAHGEDLEHRGCASHARRELRDLLDRDDERGRDE